MEITEGQLARLLLKARFVSPIQLKECRDAVAEKRGGKRSDKRPAADLSLELIHKSYCSSEQLKQIIDAHNAKRGRMFGEIALKLHLLTQEDLDAALAQQKELRERGQKTRIGALLVGRDLMKAHQVESILKEQGKRIARCIHCGAVFNVRISATADKFKCKKCGKISPLNAPKEGDADLMTVDDTLVGAPAIAPIASLDSGGFPPVTSGDVFGDYVVKQKLGQDHLGTTYKASREADGRVVALKVLDKRHANDQSFIDALQKRVKQVAQLKHPALRRVFSMGTSKAGTYVALDFIQGESLYSLLAHDRQPSARKSLAIAVQLCDALEHIHEHGVVHGDIRPSTVMISRKGRVVLANLGLSIRPAENIRRIAESSGLAPFYVAPEQIGGKRETDLRSDIYGLGATLYHLLAGRPPFEGQDPSELLLRFSDDSFPPPSRYAPRVPEAVSQIVVKTLAADPDERYQTIAELRDDLAHPERVANAQSTKMVEMLKDDADLRALGRGLSSTGGVFVIGAIAVVLLIIGAVLGLQYQEEAEARKELTARYQKLSLEYVKGRDQLLAQKRIQRDLKSFLAGSAQLEPAQSADVRKMIKDLDQRHKMSRAKKRTELRSDILAKCASGDYDLAEELRTSSLRNFGRFAEVAGELDKLEGEIRKAQESGYAKLLSEADALLEAGKIDDAVAVMKSIKSPPFDDKYETQAEAAIARYEQARAAASQAEVARRRAESKARAEAALKSNLEIERRHDLRGAIKQLEKVQLGLHEEHRPLLTVRIALLQRQLKVLSHLERLDVKADKLQVTVDGKRYTVESISAAFLVLYNDTERRNDVTWGRLTSADVLRLASETQTKAKDPKALQLAMVLFALRHDMPEEALRLVSVDALALETDAKPYRAEAESRVRKTISTALTQAAAQKDARARLLACLAAERRYRGLLAMLADQAKALRTAIATHLDAVGGGGSIVDFDGDFASALSGTAPSTVKRHADQFARLSRARLLTKAQGKRPVCVIFAPRPGEARMTVKHGSVTISLNIGADGTLRGWMLSGKQSQLAPQKLAGPRDRWRVLELRLIDGKLTALLDGVTLVAAPGGQETGALTVHSAGAAAIDVDLLFVGKK